MPFRQMITMKNSCKLLLLALSLVLYSSFTAQSPGSGTQKYKCMVQLTNYEGEGAYIVVSVLDQDNNYLRTLRVLGDDDEWYPDLSNWWSFHKEKNKPDIDGITGATIAGGERSVFVLDIPGDLIDAGNKLRFETAVEHQKYVEEDLKVPLTAAGLNGKFEGSEYIRYVRLIPNK